MSRITDNPPAVACAHGQVEKSEVGPRSQEWDTLSGWSAAQDESVVPAARRSPWVRSRLRLTSNRTRGAGLPKRPRCTRCQLPAPRRRTGQRGAGDRQAVGQFRGEAAVGSLALAPGSVLAARRPRAPQPPQGRLRPA